MILTLRKFLLFFLVLLQFFAPFTHAHADEHFVDLGLHVPTLEIYAGIHKESHYRVNDCQSSEHVIISVGDGIKNKKQSLKLFSKSFIAVDVFCFSVALKSCKINFSPQAFIQTATSVFIPAHSPRAPPVFSLL